MMAQTSDAYLHLWLELTRSWHSILGTFLQNSDVFIHVSGKSRGWFGSDSDVTRPKRRYMGITMLTLTPAIINELRTRYNQPFSDVTKGVLVHKIVVGSPAFE